MRILSSSEQQAFDKPPQFDYPKRKKFFEFSTALLDIAFAMSSIDHQAGFLVNCGYFRATRQFFMPEDFEPRDVAYVANQLGADVTSAITYPNRTRQRHQQLILDFYGFSLFDVKAETALMLKSLRWRRRISSRG